jgi:glycosyltransferase involved in cell wall biosynthesis
LNYLFDISSIFKLAKILKREHINILHTHGYKANVIGALASWLCGQTICIRTEHGLTEPFRGFDKLKMSFYEYLDYLTGKYLTRKIISVSSNIKQNIMDKYPKKKIVTIHNGIGLFDPCLANNERLRMEFGIDKRNFIIGIIGRLVPVKGHNYFINAAKLILQQRQDVRFLIVGDGPLKSALESKVSAMRVANISAAIRSLSLSDYVKFTGFRNDVKEIIKIMDIVVFSSLNEGIPYSLLEAMAQGKVIVATKVGGITEVVSDGENGLLVRSRDEEAIAEKCLYLLENKAIMQNLAKKAENTIKDNFSIEKMKEETIRIYEESLIE